MEIKKGFDTHSCVNVLENECVVITFPISGWYKIAGHKKEIWFRAGDQLILNGPFSPSNPGTGDQRIDR
jgi:hypothetical protein